MSLEKIGKAMILLRDENRDAAPPIRFMHAKSHLERLGDGLERRGDLISWDLETFQLELRPHQEMSRLAVGVMVGVEDVPAVVMDEPRDTGDDSFAIPTVDQENNRVTLSAHGTGSSWTVGTETVRPTLGTSRRAHKKESGAPFFRLPMSEATCAPTWLLGQGRGPKRP
jgi:hypothetical protein